MPLPSPTQSQAQAALRAFLLAILPAGIEVVAGQDNRVPEPASDDFVVMTALWRRRLGTNIHRYADVAFTGSIVGTTMTVTAKLFGSILIGATVFGVGVQPGTIVTAITSGNGGAGTYTVSLPQTVASAKLSAGSESITQHTEVTYQLDVHGPNSPDNAQTISTLFRDDFAVQQFLASGFDVVPLYADDPKQIPFINAEQQTETRWVIEAVMQANQTIAGLPQQFADQLEISTVNVGSAFPIQGNP